MRKFTLNFSITGEETDTYPKRLFEVLDGDPVIEVHYRRPGLTASGTRTVSARIVTEASDVGWAKAHVEEQVRAALGPGVEFRLTEA